MKPDHFQPCGHYWVFKICWPMECNTFTASSFRIWNSSTGIPSPPLALFIVMLPKTHFCRYNGYLELNLPIPVHFSSLIPKMSIFTLAISCLTTSNLPWFMDLTFQVPMQYCSLQHQTLFPPPVTSITGCCFHLAPSLHSFWGYFSTLLQ